MIDDCAVCGKHVDPIVVKGPPNPWCSCITSFEDKHQEAQDVIFEEMQQAILLAQKQISTALWYDHSVYHLADRLRDTLDNVTRKIEGKK